MAIKSQSRDKLHCSISWMYERSGYLGVLGQNTILFVQIKFLMKPSNDFVKIYWEILEKNK